MLLLVVVSHMSFCVVCFECGKTTTNTRGEAAVNHDLAPVAASTRALVHPTTPYIAGPASPARFRGEFSRNGDLIASVQRYPRTTMGTPSTSGYDISCKRVLIYALQNFPDGVYFNRGRDLPSHRHNPCCTPRGISRTQSCRCPVPGRLH